MKKQLIFTLLTTILLICMYYLDTISFNLFHLIVEIITMVIGVIIFTIFILSYKRNSNSLQSNFGHSILVISFMILLHIITDKGMNVIPGYDANLPTQLWISGSIILSISILVQTLFIGRKIKRWILISLYTSLGLVLAVLCFTRIFPDCYVEGVGLTTFKKIMEYVIISVFLLSLIIVIIKRNKLDKRNFLIYIVVITAFLVSELMLALYNNTFDIEIILGYYFRLFGFIVLFYHAVSDNIKDPYKEIIEDLELSKLKTEFERDKALKYFNLANIIFLVIDSNLNVGAINKKGCEILGTAEENILGRNWLDNFIPKNQVAEVKKVFEKVLAGELSNVGIYENHFIAAKGEERIIEWHNSAMKDEKGRVIGILSAGNDITKRKASEKALIESEEKFKYVFENSVIGRSLTLPTGELQANKSFSNMLGYKKEELKSINYQAITHPDDIEISKQVIDRMLTGKEKTVNFKKRYIKKDGSVLWAEVHTLVRKDSMGNPLYFITSIIDITDRKKAEDALKQSERRLSAAQTMAKVGSWELDLETKKIWASEEAFNIYEIESESEFIRLDIIQGLVLKQYRELMDTKLAGLISKNEKYDIEFKIRIAKTREEKSIHSKARLGYDEKGNAVKVFGTIQDITESKKMEEERETTRLILMNHYKLESLGTLASGVAHEINNPINGILNYGQIILDAEQGDNNIKEYASEIIHETNRVAVIVKNLLNFSRQNKQQHSHARIEDIISQTLTLINTILKHDQIVLELNIADNLPRIKCRSQQIQQVIMNLITNARDALNLKYPEYDDNKKIQLTCTQYNSNGRKWLKLIIEDYGIGISKDYISRIYDPFFTTKGQSEGTGLGLSISYGIIRDHHGEMIVESEEGKYTRFIVTLPCDNGWELS